MPQILIFILLLFTGWSTFPAFGQGLFDGPVDRLPAIERAQLREGQVVITGSDGQYTARILINATLPQVWAVLTDYANLANFIPNMTASRVLEDRGSEKVVEQVDSRQVLLFRVVSRTVLAIREEHLRRINFRLTAGDLQSLEGSWQIDPVSFVPRTPPTQVLITYIVSVQPQAHVPASTFFEIFANSIRDTLTAVAREVRRRQG